jgi:hypothetical protein
MDAFEQLVPIKEAPNHIPYAEKTLRNWRNQGNYPQLFVKFGGKVFVDLKEAEKMLEEQKLKFKTK